MSRSGSPSKVLGLLVNGGVGDGPSFGFSPESTGGEVVRRAAEWERQIETLDYQEMELHQTQLKLIREQTATFIRDLSMLRQEVARVRSRQDALVAELAVGVDTKHEELRALVDKGHKERDFIHSQLHNRLTAFEQELPNHKSQLNDLKGMMRDLPVIKQELDKKSAELDQKLASHNKAHQERFDYHHGSLNQRLDNLMKDVELIVSQRMGALESGVRDMRAAIGADGKMSMKEIHAHHATIAERVAFLERAFGDSAEKQHKDMQTAAKRLDDLHGKLSEHHSTLVHHSTMQERLAYLERVVGDAADKHSKEMATAHSKIQEMHGRVALAERHGFILADLQKDRAQKDEHHANLQERILYLERVLGDSATRHDAEISALKAAHDKHAGALAKHAKEVEGLRSAHTHHATVAERLSFLEKHFGGSADRHAEEVTTLRDSHTKVASRLTQAEGDLEALKAAHDKHAAAFSKHARDVESLKGAHTHHATVPERLAFIERTLGDSADKHAAELAALKQKADQLHSRIEGERGEREKHHNAIKEMLAKEKDQRDVHHATVKERVEYLESVVGDRADKHARELAETRSVASKVANDLKARESQHGSLAERLERLERSHGEAAGKAGQELRSLQAKVESALDQLHSRLAHCEGHGAAVADLQKAHASLANEKAALATHHAGMKERMAYLESVVGDSADKHAKMLEAAHAKLEQMHGRLTAAEKAHAAVGELKKAHSELASKHVVESHQASMQERVTYLEQMLGSSTDKHAKELEALKSAHERQSAALAKHARDVESLKGLHTHHATVAERLAFLERSWGDSADKHAAELAAVKQKADQLHSKMEGERGEREKHHSAIKEMLAKEKEHRDVHHATVKERVEYLESIVGDKADKHARELAEAKSLTGKLANDLKARETHHGLLAERLDRLERNHGEATSKSGQELRAHQTKVESALDHLHSRLATCENHGTAVAELKKAHASFANEKAALATHQAGIKERMAYLESLVGDSADKHAKMLEAAHSKIDQMHGRLATAEKAHAAVGELKKAHSELASSKYTMESHHASIQERVAYLEQMLGTSTDKHAKELEALKSSHERQTAALAKHARDVESLKGLHTHHATFAERLAFLERSIGDSADKHTAELAALKQKAEQLHGKMEGERAEREKHHSSIKEMLAKEKDQRDVHHASVKERVEYLENIIGDKADKHAKDIAETKSLASKLAGDMKSRETHHGAIADRLERVERQQGEVSKKVSEEMRVLHSKVDTVYASMSAVKNAWEQDKPASGVHRGY